MKPPKPLQSTYEEISPKLHALKPYIKLYYRQKAQEANFYEQIIYYPNYTTTLNLYRNSQLSWSDYSRTHQYQPGHPLLILLVSKFDKSREIITQGPLEKISIVFHPLGINHFLDKPLSNFAQEHFSFFDYYGSPFTNLIEGLWQEEDMSSIRDHLDRFFMEKWQGFQEEGLSLAVHKILETEGNISIQEIAQDLNISRKTLLRWFSKHLAYPPRAYRNIVRFRSALNRYQSSQPKPALAALAYDSHYYDQSDLNAQVKELSGLSPQQLFTRLQTIQKGLYWNINHVPKVQDPGE